MIEKYGYKLGVYLWKKGVLDCEDDIDDIRYAVVALSSDICNTVGIFIVALLFHRVWDMIVYLICFHLLRRNAGGYHASSFFACVMLTLLDFIFCIWYLTWANHWITFGFLGISIVIFFRNKPFFTEEQWQYPLISIKHHRCCIISILLLTIAIACHTLSYVSYFHTIGVVMLQVALSLKIGRFQYERMENCS